MWWDGEVDFFVRVWSDMQTSLERESAMMFYDTLMCCEYRDVSLLTRVQPSQRAMASCDYSLTGSKYAFRIQPSAMDLSMNDKICEPCTSCRIVMYIDIDNARNYNKFDVNPLCHYYGILHHHAKLLWL